MSVLGISGFAGSGKDTIADYLIEQQGWSGKLSFARNLKDMCKHAFHLTEYQVSDHEGKKSVFPKGEERVLDVTAIGAILTWIVRTHPHLPGGAAQKPAIKKFIKEIQGKTFSTPREILQFVGTDICRTIHPTYHIDIVRQILQGDGNWVITDVRFPNEAEMVQEVGGSLIRVERPSLSQSEVHRHSSETALADWPRWDSIIVNNSNVEDLYTTVDKFLQENDLWQTTT